MSDLPPEKEFVHTLFCQQIQNLDIHSARQLLIDLHLLYLGHYGGDRMTETVEYTLDAKQLAELSLFMLGKYKEWCNQPKFSHLTFEQWLQQIIDRDKDGSTN